MIDIPALIKRIIESDKRNGFDLEIAQAVLGADNPVWETHVGVWLKSAKITTDMNEARGFFFLAFPGWLYRILECSKSDDAWTTPDFNHPQHGAVLSINFPEACLRDPVEWVGSDISLEPSGRPALALCVSMLISKDTCNAWNNHRATNSQSAFTHKPLTI